MKNLSQEILTIISDICDIEDISLECLIIDDIGISSVTIVEIIATIEQTLDIELERELYNLSLYETIGDLVHKIEGVV